ncbi:MAG TPA: aminotransferase class III-fold pyridoxal phosphate-dependent enzyme, partial [Marinagarivorans sp.]
MSPDQILELDRQTLWHPYSNLNPKNPLFPVKSARECVITLSDGRQLIDGMASWWSAIHGYNHPALNNAVKTQLDDMAHVMFGGLTHEPAVALAQKLVNLTPPGLERVFLADSGSVSVEVALKMARQYWVAKNKPEKQHLLAFESAYHGDTFGAMSVCDPHNGMHKLFAGSQDGNVFCPAPTPVFGQAVEDGDLEALKNALHEHSDRLAAVIIEPI